MSEILFRVRQRLTALALLLLLPFTGVSATKLFASTLPDKLKSFPILKSDTVAQSIVIVNTTYNTLPGEGDDPLDHLEYYNYPICQVRPMDLSALITSTDSTELTGVYMEVYIEQGEYSETFSSTQIALAPGDTAMLTIPDYIPPLQEGFYEIEYTIHWDQQESESLPTATRNFGINQNGDAFIYTGNSTGVYPDVFSRDNGEIIAFTEDMGNGSSFMVGIFYSFTEFAEICCLGVTFAPGSDAGSVVDLELREPVDLEFLTATDPIYLNNDPFGGQSTHWSSFGYDPDPGFPYFAFPGDKLLATARVYNPQESSVRIGINSHNAADSSAYIFGEFDDLDCTAGCPTNELYMIRIGLSSEFCTTSLAEITDIVSDFNCAPNPTNGQFSVHYTLAEKGDVQFFLFDSMGRIVSRQNPGNQTKGEYKIYPGTQSLADGVYTASLMVNGKVISKQLIVGLQK